MPVYSFMCSECGATDERVRRMKNADKKCMCKCGVKMVRDWSADTQFASGGEYHKAIHSDSLAISPDQREEHLKAFPDIKLDKQNRPVFDNYSDHQKYLDKCNIVKERKKVKPKGVRIA